MPLYDKIETIAREIYGADGVDYTKQAKDSLDGFIKLGADKMPVCMAKRSTVFPIIRNFSADRTASELRFRLPLFLTAQASWFAKRVRL